MKRSNRLVLLVGVFLAIVAFIAIIVLNGSGRRDDTKPAELEQPTVVAAVDIPLGAKITADKVTTIKLPPASRSGGAYGDPTQVLGKKVRQAVVANAQLTPETFGETAQGQIFDIEVPKGKRAITVQVDQVTGVGTVIKTGDYVDMVVLLPPDQFPVITANAQDNSFTVVAGLNGTSVKLLLQGMQVLGTLLPPAAAAVGSARDELERPAGDRRPRGGRPDGRSHQVRPGPRQRLADPAIRRRLHRPRDGPPAGDSAAAGRDDRHHPQDPRRSLRRPTAGAHRDRPSGATAPVGKERHDPPVTVTQRDGRDGPRGPAPVVVGTANTTQRHQTTHHRTSESQTLRWLNRSES